MAKRLVIFSLHRHQLMNRNIKFLWGQGHSVGGGGTGPCLSTKCFHSSCNSIPRLMRVRVYPTSKMEQWRSFAQKSESTSGSRSVSTHERMVMEPEPEGNAPYVVYDGLLKRQLKHVKLFSLATTMGGLPLQPMIYNNAEHGTAATVALLSVVGFFTYVTPFLIHQLAKKYVTDISYDPITQQYTAATYSFFLRRKELVFKKEDVVVPDVPGPFTSVLVGKEGVALFFAMESFIYPNHYGLIMGYDKPLDLHISPEDITAAVDRKMREEQEGSKKSL